MQFMRLHGVLAQTTDVRAALQDRARMLLFSLLNVLLQAILVLFALASLVRHARCMLACFLPSFNQYFALHRAHLFVQCDSSCFHLILSCSRLVLVL
jgi:hypothetical protein